MRKKGKGAILEPYRFYFRQIVKVWPWAKPCQTLGGGGNCLPYQVHLALQKRSFFAEYTLRSPAMDRQTQAHSAVLSTPHQRRFLPIPASDYNSHSKTFLFTRRQSFWSSLSTNKLRNVKPFISPWSTLSQTNRRWETALARLRIGHTRFTHSHLVSYSNPPLCSSCNVPLSVPHTLLSCFRFAPTCSSTFPHLARIYWTSSHNIPNLLL